MKNSKEYATKIKKLFTGFKKGAGKIKKVEFSDPVEAMIFAIVTETVSESSAKSIIKKLDANFVDRNDLRVSRSEEILEIIGNDSKKSDKIAIELTGLLNSVFNKYDRISLSEIGVDGKRAAKEILEKFEGMTNYVCSYVMLVGLDGHAIPINDSILDYLKDYDLVHPDATIEETSAFLERQISAADAYTFYTLLRADVDSSKPIAKTLFTKTDTKKTVKKKTTKKKK